MKFKKKYIVTVDIGGTKINIGYFCNGKLMQVSNFPTKKYGPENILAISETLINSKKNISVINIAPGPFKTNRAKKLVKNMKLFEKNLLWTRNVRHWTKSRHLDRVFP